MSDRQREALEAAREKLQEQHELIERLTATPLKIGRVLERSPDGQTLKVSMGLEHVELASPNFPVETGQEVACSETGQIVHNTAFVAIGPVTVAKRIVDSTLCEVEIGGSTKLVRSGELKIELGDEILLDSSMSLVLRKLSEATDQQFEFQGETGVRWNDIGGLDEAKQAIQEAVELPFSFPDLFKWYNKRPIKGIELHGPPGCGKTMLAKALVTSLADRNDGKVGFFYIKGPEILDPYVGVAESSVRRIFAKSRLHKKKTGNPGIVFIDEADAILSKRGTGISSDMEKTIVPTFLAEMDGLDDFGTIVVLATNRPDMLDPAVVRPGRIDRAIAVRRPNVDETATIFEIYLKKVPIKKGTTPKTLSKRCANMMFSEDRSIYKITKKNGDCSNFTLGHMSSGALIANVVDHAVSHCLHQDLLNRRTRTGTGVSEESLNVALDKSHAEVADGNHDAELKLFMGDRRNEVVEISKLKATA